MKKIVLILTALMVVGCIGCNRTQGKPVAPDVEKQEALERADMAIFDNGKLIFYNSTNNHLIPLTVEKESVVDGIFYGDDSFYYTVVIGDKLYLKRVNTANSNPSPEMLTDWGLNLSDCFAETCDVAPMRSYSNVPVIEIQYELDGEYCEYFKELYYRIDNQTKIDRWPDDINKGGSGDDGDLQLLNDQDLFKTVEVEDETASEDEEGYKTYYYFVPDQSGDTQICISDKIDFDKLGGYYQPSFQLYGIDQTRKYVVYAAWTDWGHVGHGPLCFATLDGKVQKILVSDAVGAYWGWLNDGRLAYADNDGIKVVSPDGREQQISTATKLVTKQ